jgi:Predicted nucleotide-binding protein containing TIR-like domain
MSQGVNSGCRLTNMSGGLAGTERLFGASGCWSELNLRGKVGYLVNVFVPGPRSSIRRSGRAQSGATSGSPAPSCRRTARDRLACSSSIIGSKASFCRNRATASRRVVFTSVNDERTTANPTSPYSSIFSNYPAPRARQIVLVELGYFIDKLTRQRVCTLQVAEAEVPSDWAGVVNAPFERGGAWRQVLARESSGRLWNEVIGTTRSNRTP